MDWNKIKALYPNKWVIVKAVRAYTDLGGIREISDMEVIDIVEYSVSAYRKYIELHKNDSCGEYYYLHTSREKLDISEEIWIGIRPQNAAPACYQRLNRRKGTLADFFKKSPLSGIDLTRRADKSREHMIGQVRTKRKTVTLALKELIERRRQKQILDLQGKITFKDGWDYKKERTERGSDC